MPDYRLTFDVKDVALGDVLDLADEVMKDHGEAYDADRGDLSFVVLEKAGEGVYVPVDREGDE